jgi:hypothetical protein
MKFHFGDFWATRVVNSKLDTGIVDALVFALTVLPLLLTPHLPLTDVPNHLARQYIINNLQSDPNFQTFYQIRWALVPNLALDIFVLIASHLMSIDLAVRLFCIISMLFLFFGVKLISQNLGTNKSRIYLISPLLCYGGPLQFGFLNYCFGIGLSLVIFGLYLKHRHLSTLRLTIMFAPCAFLLLLCHLAAFGIYAAAVGAYEILDLEDIAKSRSRPLIAMLKRQIKVACHLVPPFLIFVALSPTTNGGLGVRWGTFYDKIEAVAAITMFANPRIELALFVFAALGLTLALLSRVVSIPRRFLPILLVLALIWLAVPRVGLGGGFIDYRVPWGASFFLLAGLVPSDRRTALSMLLGVLFTGLVIVRIGSIIEEWLSWEPTLAAIDNALGSLPPGARLMVVEGRLNSTSAARQPALDHVAAYAVARRQAFEPQMFASFSGQILYFQPRYKNLWELNPPSTLVTLDPAYDYVLVLWPKFAKISPNLNLVCKRRGQDFYLLEVSDVKALTTENQQPISSQSDQIFSCAS